MSPIIFSENGTFDIDLGTYDIAQRTLDKNQSISKVPNRVPGDI